MSNFKPEQLLDVLPIDNVTEDLSPIIVSKTIEVQTSIPARSRCNPVALGWLSLFEGMKRRHCMAARRAAQTGPYTFEFYAPTDQSFFVLGVMLEFTGSELTPSSPFDVTVTAINNGVTISTNVLSGDIKDIRAGADGQRNMAVVMFSMPVVQYGIPTSAGQVVTSSTSLQDTVITGIGLVHADTELADLPKADRITVAVTSINTAYQVSCQLLTPGNNNFDALVNGLFKHEIDGKAFSIADYFAQTM